MDVARQHRQLTHRHLVAGIGQPVGIGEGRFRHAQFPRPLGQHTAKARSLPAMPSASTMQASLPLGMTAAVQEVVDGDLAVNGGKHGRGARRRPALAPGVLADVVFVGQLEVALLEGVKNGFDRHQFSSCWTAPAARRRSSRTARCRWWPRSGSRSARRHRSRLPPFGALHALVGGIDQAAPADRGSDRARDQAAPKIVQPPTWPCGRLICRVPSAMP